ncbi:MAG: hypothetical protein L0Y66_27030, partial [Myxococcaceae bacterium]|nr:hypothetical protein [Myxococcaceae bacterium]
MRSLVGCLLMLGLLVGSGCVVHAHGPRRPTYEVDVEYRYSGYHPIPMEYGGGWCDHVHAHVHDYLPEGSRTYWRYSDSMYFYRGPTVVYYYASHVDPSGRACSLHGRHRHDYLPPAHAASAYQWDRNRGGYVYRPSHPATPAGGWSNPTPPNQGRPSWGNPRPGGNGNG